ncbi:histidine kinase [Sinomicrobium pectinilyticum]|uniref:Histidine kinase n=2 Tax=Sinomicrobium pectinilyticum TaxID=1084421 RepID=A0A3N0EEN3_SINP1|nr:histidine kinase [Sinomicrobium pectinilyticum]
MLSRLNDKISLNEKSSLKLHFIFWSVIFIFNLSTHLFIEKPDSVSGAYTIGQKALILLFHLSAVIVTCYFIVLRVLPLLSRKNQIGRAVLEMVIGIYLICILSRSSIVYGLEPMLGRNFVEQETLFEIAFDIDILIQHYLPGIITGSVPFFLAYLLVDRYQIQQKHMQAEKDKRAAELYVLKSQLNPHFLFNTLNNIYSLTIQHSHLASKSIEKLSYILDYTLYRCNDDFVSLEKEYELLNNYIQLEKIRYNDRLEIQTDFYYDCSYKIAPLLLLAVVENMFKHGVEKTTGIAILQIKLNATNKNLLLETKNTFDQSESDAQGIGLNNVQQQLQLLYPGRHHMTIEKMNNIFILKLQMQLQ